MGRDSISHRIMRTGLCWHGFVPKGLHAPSGACFRSCKCPNSHLHARRSVRKTVMKIARIDQATEWFEVLQTTDHSQAAVMRLDPGQATGQRAESHKESEQILLLLEGELVGEIGSERVSMTAGQFVIIPAGVKHKFTNPSTRVAVTFNVYCPPEYPPGEKE
jgi:mannose-6-phosphate isomerase-like protein (cupin superfamily)